MELCAVELLDHIGSFLTLEDTCMFRCAYKTFYAATKFLFEKKVEDRKIEAIKNQLNQFTFWPYSPIWIKPAQLGARYALAYGHQFSRIGRGSLLSFVKKHGSPQLVVGSDRIWNVEKYGPAKDKYFFQRRTPMYFC